MPFRSVLGAVCEEIRAAKVLLHAASANLFIHMHFIRRFKGHRGQNGLWVIKYTTERTKSI